MYIYSHVKIGDKMEVKEEKKKVLLTRRSDFPGRPCMFHSYSWLHKVTLKKNNQKYKGFPKANDVQ